jgi:membrane-bound ClpP family serine protease
MSVGLIYLACLVIGLGYALWTGLLGTHVGGDHAGAGHGAFLDFNADHAAHSGEVHFTPLSPMVIATFLGSFGGLGIIGHYALHLVWWRSMVLALTSGVLIAGVFYYVVRSLYSVTEASSEAHVSELVGETAEVTVDIGPGGTGEIVYSSAGSRYQAPARLYEGDQPIKRGARVVIRRTENGIYHVSPLEKV